MKKRKLKKPKVRIPIDLIVTLMNKKGGAQTSKGYNRAKEKQEYLRRND